MHVRGINARWAVINEDGKAVVYIPHAVYPDWCDDMFGVFSTRDGATDALEGTGFRFTTDPIGWFKKAMWRGEEIEIEASIEEFEVRP